MLTVAVIGAWIAIVLLGFGLAATRRMLDEPSAAVPPPERVDPGVAAGLPVPGVVVLVKPACPACDRALGALARRGVAPAQEVVSFQAFTWEQDGSHVPVAGRADLVLALRPPALPWVAALDADLAVTRYEPFTSVDRLDEVRRELTGAIPGGRSQP